MGLGRRILLPYSPGGAGVEITYWVIAGGGGAGRDDSFGTKFGGGGAGGVLTATVSVPTNETLTATTIGAGGSYQTSSNARGNAGNDTTFSSTTLGTITADGGGEGGGASSQNGGNGGSGGGGAGSGTGGIATSGQGNNGGNSQGGNWSAGGGGKAATGTNTSNGGAGINIIYAKTNQTLATEMFAYGGGSRQGASPYSAGLNGDGTSSDTGRNTTAGVSGEPYRGSGGRWQGGGGNSGSILVRAPLANTAYSTSGTVIVATDSNYRYFTMASTGSAIAFY